MIDQALALPNENLEDEHNFTFENMMYRNQAREIASMRIEQSQEKSKSRFDHHRDETRFEIGDLVWVKFPQGKVGRAKKLLYQYRGPYQLLTQTAPNNFEITDARGKTEIMNVERFKIYHHRHNTPNHDPNHESQEPNPAPNHEISDPNHGPNHESEVPNPVPNHESEVPYPVPNLEINVPNQDPNHVNTQHITAAEPQRTRFSNEVTEIHPDGTRTTSPISEPKLDVFPEELLDTERLDSLFETSEPQIEVEEQLEPITARRSSRQRKQTNLNFTFI